MGLGEPISTSAVHGLGEVTLLETIVEQLKTQGTLVPSNRLTTGWVPTGNADDKVNETDKKRKSPVKDDEEDKEDKFALQEVKISIVGKPNVGKERNLLPLIFQASLAFLIEYPDLRGL